VPVKFYTLLKKNLSNTLNAAILNGLFTKGFHKNIKLFSTLIKVKANLEHHILLKDHVTNNE